MEQINYQDVIELGFEREDMEDHIFYKQNGFRWFLVTRKLYKGIVAEWDCVNKTVEIVRYKKSFVKGRLPVKNLYELKDYIEFFTKKPKL